MPKWSVTIPNGASFSSRCRVGVGGAIISSLYAPSNIAGHSLRLYGSFDPAETDLANFLPIDFLLTEDTTSPFKGLLTTGLESSLAGLSQFAVQSVDTDGTTPVNQTTDIVIQGGMIT